MYQFWQFYILYIVYYPQILLYVDDLFFYFYAYVLSAIKFNLTNIVGLACFGLMAYKLL